MSRSGRFPTDRYDRREEERNRRAENLARKRLRENGPFDPDDEDDYEDED